MASSRKSGWRNQTGDAEILNTLPRTGPRTPFLGGVTQHVWQTRADRRVNRRTELRFAGVRAETHRRFADFSLMWAVSGRSAGHNGANPSAHIQLRYDWQLVG